MAAPQQPRFVPFVTDLGLKSDLNMHRAHSGSFRVRIEARQRVVAAIDFRKADLRAEQRPKWPAAARNFNPLSRFPQGASRGGTVPPTPEARCAPAKGAVTHRCRRLPPQEGCRPLVHPLRARVLYPQSVRQGEHSRNENKDGRHVLDFYDLLIEPIMHHNRLPDTFPRRNPLPFRGGP